VRSTTSMLQWAGNWHVTRALFKAGIDRNSRASASAAGAVFGEGTSVWAFLVVSTNNFAKRVRGAVNPKWAEPCT